MGVGRPSFRQFVFSPMTSFTHRPGTSFTLPARAVRTLGCNRDGVEDDDVQEQRVRFGLEATQKTRTFRTTQYAFLPGLNFQNAYTYDAASNRTSLTAPDNRHHDVWLRHVEPAERDGKLVGGIVRVRL